MSMYTYYWPDELRRMEEVMANEQTRNVLLYIIECEFEDEMIKYNELKFEFPEYDIMDTIDELTRKGAITYWETGHSNVIKCKLTAIANLYIEKNVKMLRDMYFDLLGMKEGRTPPDTIVLGQRAIEDRYGDDWYGQHPDWEEEYIDIGRDDTIDDDKKPSSRDGGIGMNDIRRCPLCGSGRTEREKLVEIKYENGEMVTDENDNTKYFYRYKCDKCRITFPEDMWN